MLWSQDHEFDAKCVMPVSPAMANPPPAQATPVPVKLPAAAAAPVHANRAHHTDSNAGSLGHAVSAPQPTPAAADPLSGMGSQPSAASIMDTWSSRPGTADTAASVANSIPPTTVHAEIDASMRRANGVGPGPAVDVGDGVPARKKLLRKKSEPYIPRRACLQEVRQRLHVSHDALDPLCKEDDLICSICLVGAPSTCHSISIACCFKMLVPVTSCCSTRGLRPCDVALSLLYLAACRAWQTRLPGCP